MHACDDGVIVAPHSNIQATSMSVDTNGEIIILASKRHLSLINFCQPNKVVKKVNLNSKWDISHVIWNPNRSHREFFITTYNQCTDLWQYNEPYVTALTTFSGHTRVVSDADWSRCAPDVFATCSLDNYIYLWDIRDYKKPKLATSTIAGASQVKWNKFNQNCLATAHDGNIRIWDIRNGKSPSQYITAHVSKINYLDWSWNTESELASASQDTTIRFWDTSEIRRNSKFQINMQYPVWRAKYTPFGMGMTSLAFLTFIETPLALWNITDAREPVHVYNDHKDVVLDFQWVRQNKDQDWCLVTWCKDQSLRFWRADYGLLIGCGALEEATQLNNETEFYNETKSSERDFTTNSPQIKVVKPPSSISSTGTNANLSVQTSDDLKISYPVDPFIDDLSSQNNGQFLGTSPSSILPSKLRSSTIGTSPHRLEQEFQLLNVSLPNLIMHQIDTSRRICILSLRSATQYLKLHISFPPLYPQNAVPIFQFVKWSDSVSQESREKLLKTLQETAQHHVRSNRSCLEPCLRQLTAQFSAMSYVDSKDREPESQPTNDPLVHDHVVLRTYRDLHSIPFPRTSGARFSSVGYLVIFMRPTHVKGFQSSSGKTPRSFSSLLSHRNSAPSLPMGFTRHVASPFSAKHSIYGTSPSSMPSEPLVSSFYYKEKKPSRKSLKRHHTIAPKEAGDSFPTSSSYDLKQNRMHRYVGQVVIIDLTRILPISKMLSSQYAIPEASKFREACLHNKAEAQTEDMNDLVELWSCVSLLPNPRKTSLKLRNEFEEPFSATPMGRPFLSKLIEHYSKLKDVQTLAMLACTFCNDPPASKESQVVKSSPVKRSFSYGNFENVDGSLSMHKSTSESKFDYAGISMWFNMIAKSPTSSETFSTRSFLLPTSPGSSPDEYLFEEPPSINNIPSEVENWNKARQMLETDSKQRYDAFKDAYCDILSRWKMNVQVSEIRKHSSDSAPLPDLMYMVNCQACDNKSPKEKFFLAREKTCSSPFHGTMICLICQLPVWKLASFCSKCFHGGHADHMKEWFRDHTICPSPTNCNCECVL
ncbi:unnamed protein product [Clavelina lepadiformis]|uniref:RWD domain-containing protein n=2 Tax=Clavelina lepadiformis TaxID=159417 RepID=A0ABP0FZV5_CLALP